MKKKLWSTKMKNAHRMVRYMPFIQSNTYRQNLSIAMKVQHMIDHTITFADINWLMNYLGSKFVNLHLEHLKKTALFEITGGVSEIDVYHYVKPRTQEQDNKAIGVMIASEIKSGRKLNLD